MDGCPSVLAGYCRAKPTACLHSKIKYAWKVSCTQGILLVSLCRKFKPGWCEHNTSTNTSTKRFCLHRTGSHLRVLFVLVNQPYVLFLFQKHWSRWQYSNSSRSKHFLIFVKNAREELVIFYFYFASVKQLALSVGSVALFNDEALGVILYRWT